MFNFRCPGCGKLHPSALPPEQVVEQRCLRCGEIFQLLRPEKTEKKLVGEPALAAASATDSSTTANGEQPIPGGTGKSTSPAFLPEDLIPLADGPPLLPELPLPDRKKPRQQNEDPEEELPDDQATESDEEISNPRRRRWPLLGGIAAMVLLAAGGGGYFFWFGRHSTTESKAGKTASVAKATTTKAKGKTTSTSKASSTTKAQVAQKTASPTSPGKSAVPPGPPQPEVPAKDRPLIRISAPRLAAELAANAEQTNRKYRGARMEVTGLFLRLDRTTPPFGIFATTGPVVGCVLDGASGAEVRAWTNLPPGTPISVVGDFGNDARLHNSVLIPLSAAADSRYRGKEVELVGYVDSVNPLGEESEFPSLALECDTCGAVAVDCLFRKNDGEELKKLQPGQLVTISGTCNGRRQHSEHTYHVRLDNCRLIHTSAPTAPTVRVDIVRFLREYTEDLSTDLQPMPGEEPTGPAVSVAQFEKAFEANPRALDQYLNKVLTITGKPVSKRFPVMTVVSGNTDQALKVSCNFTRRNFRRLDDRSDFTIRGLFTSLTRQTLRLDNCELFDPLASKDRRRATAEYFPYVPGKSLVYDFARHPASGKGDAVVTRQVVFERGDGVIESLITYTGTLPAGKQLLHGDKPGSWILNRKTRKVALTGPTYRYRISGTLIELGQQTLGKENTVETVWHPVLRIGAMTGDSWQWTYGTERYEYTVEKFEASGRRPCVIIRELVLPTVGSGQTLEIRHVFGLDVGYVERQEIVHLTSRDSRIVLEMRLVEEDEPQPNADGHKVPKTTASTSPGSGKPAAADSGPPMDAPLTRSTNSSNAESRAGKVANQAPHP
jgi:hypothetical protein